MQTYDFQQYLRRAAWGRAALGMLAFGQNFEMRGAVIITIDNPCNAGINHFSKAALGIRLKRRRSRSIEVKDWPGGGHAAHL